jgi:phosphoglycolate phosphatase
MPESVKALIFDLDGTLADTLPDLAGAVNWSLKLNGFPIHKEEDYLSYIGNGSEVLVRKALGREVSPEVFQKVFSDYLTYYLAHVAVKTRPFCGMKEDLAELRKRGLSLFCLTNKPEEAAQELIQALFGSLFTAVIGNSGKTPTKPDPQGMLKLLEDYHLKPEEVSYFGDSDVDMILADKTGIVKKIAVAYGYRPLKELTDLKPYAVIYRPKEILSLDFIPQGK